MFSPHVARRRGAQTLAWAIPFAWALLTGYGFAAEPESDPLFEAYRQIDRQIVAPGNLGMDAPAPPVAPAAGIEFPELSPRPIGQPAPEAQPTAAPRRPVALSEAINPASFDRAVSDPRELPVLAVIDFDSDTLDPAGLLTLTQVVWSEAQRAERTRMLELDTTRHILSRNNLTPSDPYRPSPSRHQLATVLNADYLILGNVNHVEKTFVAELVLYSASSNSIVNSVTEIATDGFQALLRKFPNLVRSLVDVLPRVGAPPGGGAEAGGGRSALLAREVGDLRLENERMRAEIVRLRRQVTALGGNPAPAQPMPRPTASPAASGAETVTPIAPLKVDDLTADGKLPPVQGQYVKKPLTQQQKTRIKESTPAPTPVRVAQVAPTPMPTAIPTMPGISTLPTAQPTVSAAPTPTAAPAPGHGAEPVSAPTSTPAAAATPAVSNATQPTPAEADDSKARARKFYDESFKFPFNSREAIEPLSRAVELDPSNETYKHALLTRLYYTGDYSTCARRGEEFAAAGAKNPEIFIFTGAGYTALGEYQKALAMIDRAIKNDPQNAYALYNRAINLQYLNDPRAAEAFRYYLQIARNDPRQAQYIPKAEENLRNLEAAGKPQQTP